MSWFKFGIGLLALGLWFWTRQSEQNQLTTTWILVALGLSYLVAWPTERWSMSNKVGSAQNLSVFLKFIFSANALISTLLFFGAIGVIISWFVRGVI